ncbi:MULTISPECIES: hypothetical protein [Pseudomonadaceae]|uniref:Uncharacterized protein n=1 Tax=Stutzerimonas frequens TaxID=2968969 RepID=A0AA47I0A8_9GAMM|nr:MULTISPECIES: hypothetical protein [Pseudomonadaceae]MCV6184644.1 hypothetical protein [Pseudomonas aeruginosa]MCV6217641.1 hypothetical protein [Pseudomonas aeruginosa]MCV6428577.1 hypothetical protein [Pseudomonas aeruginosa]MCV6431406.1 hypothetical protein [Pseudomonas aeruginosa]MCV6438850.1 hypothetical protein [Pseudomonas aeruginosa]
MAPGLFSYEIAVKNLLKTSTQHHLDLGIDLCLVATSTRPTRPLKLSEGESSSFNNQVDNSVDDPGFEH